MEALSHLNGVAIKIFGPNSIGTNLTPARAMLLHVLHVEGDSTLFVANKFCYFFKLMGEPEFAGMQFVPHHNGPDSESVTDMVKAIGTRYIKGVYGPDGSLIPGLEHIERMPCSKLWFQDNQAEVNEYIRATDTSTDEMCRQIARDP